ncbi:MAG: beta-lactamase family protein [Maribacter sp.]|nr:beta-lactamase family protein [Maribacter sp.]MBT8314999.1 beta-lactamase family protein [Maribacter sp.]
MKSIFTYLKDLFTSENKPLPNPIPKEMAEADELLHSLIKEKKIPGLSITVFKKGNVLFQKGYGHADIEKEIEVNPRQTIFRIASISKNIAATALARMVMDRVIELDTSFYHYVPYFPKKKYDFTIRQLANHTAGIRGYRGKEYALNKAFTIKESLQIFQDDELLFKPGTNYHYNSYDWVLISLAMQEASGIPFEQYVKEIVLDSFEMQNTFPENSSNPSRLTGNELNRWATFYSRGRLGFRKAVPVNNQYKLAGGGYLSTSHDIARFGRAFLDEEILNHPVISEFLTAETINGISTYYGLGWQVSEDTMGRSYFGHVGNGVGGYSNLFVYPKEQLVFSILTNCTNPGVQDELNKSINLILNNS